MELRKTVLALALLAIIGGFAFYISREPSPAQSKTYKLFQIAPADIAQIELHGPARDLVIERSDAGLWRIVKPVDTAADSVAVDSLASAIANLQVVDTLGTNAGDLANFGLENPAVTVTVTTKDKRVLPGVMVGSDTPIGSNTYIKTTNQSAILLIGEGFKSEANRTLNDLRSRVLINLTADQITRVAVTHPDGSAMEIARNGDTWKITRPREWPADKAAVQGLLDTIATVQVADFVEDRPQDLEKFGLANPTLELEVYGGKDNAKHSIEFGAKQPDAGKNAVFARASEGDQPVVTIADYVIKAVDQSFDDLRDKSVFAFDEARVARLTLIGGPVSIVVERPPGGKWSVIAEGRTAPAQPEVAASMLGQLHDLKGTSIVQDPMTDPPRFGMDHPNLTAVLYDQGGKEIGSVYVAQVETTSPPNPMTGKTTTKSLGYATSTGDKAVYQILPEQVVDLENTASTLKGDAAAQPAAAPGSSPGASAAAPAVPAIPAASMPGAPSLPPPPTP
jgi:hypothetical protein